MHEVIPSIRAQVNLFGKTSETRKAYWICISFIGVVKVTLATVTLLGTDYVSYLSDAAMNRGAFSWSPWILLAHEIYSFWLWLPVDHGTILAAVRTQSPELLWSYYLLTLLMKAPLVMCDILSGFLLYRLGTRLYGRSIGRKASILWLANPLVILFTEMWGSIEVAVILFTLVGLDLLLNGHFKSGALGLAAGIAVKISPIVAGFAGLVWALRRKAGRANLLMFPLMIALGTTCYFYWVTRGQVEILLRFLTDPSQYSGIDSAVIQSLNQYAPHEAYWGFATIGLAFLWIIAAEIWPSIDRTLVALLLISDLLLYGLANWLPTAFLWAVPFMILWDYEAKDHRYSSIFYALVLVYTLTLHTDLLISSGLGFLSLPRELVPEATTLIQFMLSLGRTLLMFEAQIRAIFIAYCFVYAATVLWSSLRAGGS